MKLLLLQGKETSFLRKLVRKLNSEENGFYTPGVTYNYRCNRARIRKGILQVKIVGGKWFTPTEHSFNDCYGRNVG